jgi:hypothetical protein
MSRMSNEQLSALLEQLENLDLNDIENMDEKEKARWYKILKVFW